MDDIRPKVTVVILAYNHERYLEKAIKSVLMQKTDFEYDILIGNDCSKDNTEKIILDFQKHSSKRIVMIKPHHNMGATKMLYTLLKKAKGEYIAQLEGDDFWNSEYKLQKQIDFLENHPEYSGVSSRCMVVDENDAPIEMKNKDEINTFWNFDEEIYTFDDFQKGCYPGHFNSMVYRNFYDYYKEIPRLIYKVNNIIADRTIAMLISLSGNMYRFNERLSSYRFVENKDNYQSQTRKKNIRDQEYKYICELEKYAKEKNSYADFYEIKKEKLICACAISVANINKENVNVVFKMLKASGKDFRCFLVCIKAIILKIIYLKILKTDKKINIK